MKTILIAYDGSECSDAMISELTRAGLPSQLEAHVVSVAEVWTAPVDPAASAILPAMVPAEPTARSEEALATRDASERAKQGAARVRAAFPGWRVEFSGCVGSPASSILQRARELTADVIFIGSHSRSAVGRFFLGSVSQKVATEAKCSVRICRPRAASGAALQLLVAVDGSPPSQAAVGAVAGRAWPAGTVVAAVAVIEPTLRAVEGSEKSSAAWLRQRDRMLVWLEAVNTAAHRQLELAGLVPERHVLEGRAETPAARIRRKLERGLSLHRRFRPAPPCYRNARHRGLGAGRARSLLSGDRAPVRSPLHTLLTNPALGNSAGLTRMTHLLKSNPYRKTPC